MNAEWWIRYRCAPAFLWIKKTSPVFPGPDSSGSSYRYRNQFVWLWKQIRFYYTRICKCPLFIIHHSKDPLYSGHSFKLSCLFFYHTNQGPARRFRRIPPKIAFGKILHTFPWAHISNNYLIILRISIQEHPLCRKSGSKCCNCLIFISNTPINLFLPVLRPDIRLKYRRRIM